ncbi:hypothetical protein [Ruminococcus albus]|uniref:Lipoprotein n=1 Tax=Ruminococcus albus (strain ATCC 27210 / DSM 20455 / JCM 14654 / NCDO 2250 / 7) TaxID=697329 RepID=E6UFB0_RUMA7|nr:hypothetical protein [Ruminococcus albus]ADU20996.1 hypothetical protein Rumal_0443 [Ruminococcus albus 7 = DSM 20455]
MNRKIVLVISLLAAALCLAACSNKEKPKQTASKADKETSAAKDDESAAEGEEDTLGVLKDMYEDKPSAIKGLILESKSTWRNSPDIEEMAEEGYTKEVAISDFELDEVFEMYIDTDLDDGWNIYICRQDSVGDMSSLTEEKLKELSEKGGFANDYGNKPDKEKHGDLGGMCVASDEATEGIYDMFFVRGGEIDSYIELEITKPSNAE